MLRFIRERIENHQFRLQRYKSKTLALWYPLLNIYELLFLESGSWSTLSQSHLTRRWWTCDYRKRTEPLYCFLLLKLFVHSWSENFLLTIWLGQGNEHVLFFSATLGRVFDGFGPSSYDNWKGFATIGRCRTLNIVHWFHLLFNNRSKKKREKFGVLQFELAFFSEIRDSLTTASARLFYAILFIDITISPFLSLGKTYSMLFSRKSSRTLPFMSYL